MNNLLKASAATALFALALSTATAQTAVLPSSWAGAGASYDAKAGGWFSYAVLVNKATQSYSFTTFDESLSKAKPYVVVSSVRTGACTVMKSYGPFYLLGCLDVGSATSGANTGAAYSGSGIALLKIGNTNWTLLAPVRYIRTVAPASAQTVWEFGFGRTW